MPDTCFLYNFNTSLLISLLLALLSLFATTSADACNPIVFASSIVYDLRVSPESIESCLNAVMDDKISVERVRREFNEFLASQAAKRSNSLFNREKFDLIKATLLEGS